MIKTKGKVLVVAEPVLASKNTAGSRQEQGGTEGRCCCQSALLLRGFLRDKRGSCPARLGVEAVFV